jgi:hypothetical protein
MLILLALLLVVGTTGMKIKMLLLLLLAMVGTFRFVVSFLRS